MLIFYLKNCKKCKNPFNKYDLNNYKYIFI